MISLDNLVFYYTDALKPALDNVSLEITDGAFVLVTGPSGSGKTTLLRVLNGLVPHFYGGRIGGRAVVYGLDVKNETVGNLSVSVGMVFQDSTAQFVTDTVESEIAFGLENTGLASGEIVRRVEETALLMGIQDLVGRQTATLSGGEKQKTAIASVLAMRPRALALDEPTAELDPEAAAELLEILIRLNREQRLTVILAEHRMERVIEFAGSIIELKEGRAEMGPTSTMAEKIVNAPPVIELGRKMNWKPLPLSVEEARERINEGEIASAASQPRLPAGKAGNDGSAKGPDPSVAVRVHGLSFAYDGRTVLKDIDLVFNDGEVTALMGTNGAGKTTLLKLLCGLLKADKGLVTISGMDLATATPKDIFAIAGYVPQRPGALLFADSVEEEIKGKREKGKGEEGKRRNGLVSEMGLDEHRDDYPRDLSQGEQQRVALAAILVNNPSVILFDEPTHGLDFAAKKNLSQRLRHLAAEGKAVVMATHDIELAAGAADRVVLIDGGRVAADGTPRQVMPAIPMLRTQMNEIFGGEVLTVEDVMAK
jgi:energy-coupling factor transport system ATP-binding protein